MQARLSVFILSLTLFFLILISSAVALNVSVTQEGDRLKIISDEPAFMAIKVNYGVPIFANGTKIYFKPGVKGKVQIFATSGGQEVVEEVEFTPPTSTPKQMPTIHYWWSGAVRLPFGYFIKESEQGDKYKIEWRTALGALEVASRKGGFDYVIKTTDWGPFVKCIAGKCEKSEGAFSGWMYQVNGETPSVGAREYAVKEYDEVVWFFAKNMDTTPETSSKVIRIFVFYNNTVVEEGLNETVNETQTNVTNQTFNRTFPLSFNDPRIVKALRYLKTLQKEDGGFANPGEEPSTSKTSWAIMAMVAAKQNPEWWKRGNFSAMDYLEKEIPEEVNKMGTADFARTILALYAADKDPRSFAGIDLVELLKSRVKESGQIGDFTYTTIWGLMALKVSGENVSKTVEWLIGQQNADGGFGWAPGQPSDYDDTAAAIQALVAANISCDSEVIERAFEYLKTGQNEDGGFRYFGNSSSNAASDSWIIQAIVACNGNPEKWKKGNTSVVDHLFSLQRSDGSFNYTTYQKSNPGYMTASAIMALLGKPFPIKPTEYISLNESLAENAIPTLTPTPTPTSTPTPIPTIATAKTPTPKPASPTLTPTAKPTASSSITQNPQNPEIPGFDLMLGFLSVVLAIILRRKL
ncbi:MAG: DUF4430 domain-containing protein [Archaeoglobus sp.]|nr:DUF4430 domain-containing protein [Archaeoglobus sp.]